MSEQKKIHRSVSQLNQYERCPMAYKLSRIDKVWQRPAAWLPQGTAFHTTVELAAKDLEMSLEKAQEIFSAEYDKDIGALTSETPNVQFWSRSGPYAGRADIERRYALGLEQVERWFDWHNEHPEEEFWKAPDGTPGIELGFDIDLDGVPVRGFIDAIKVIDGELVVEDYKTGNTPGDDFQLGVYSVAVEMMYGVERPQTGRYWMAGKKGGKGKPTKPYDLSEWTREAVTEKFHELDQNIRAEKFEADPEPSKCQFCDVSASCSFAMG
ncbi:exonuclease [Mycobacterium phage Saintus]|uniref:Cas4 exonuclease n=1 Tax=Mycobacterium phage Saintus TaxID=2923007 RepID=G8IRG1_9CAUD|nr:exonuclease [Mycobacterium phage Saintus]AER26461.1 Cas4 exonuclease [Mycobacterium phage Saintus]